MKCRPGSGWTVNQTAAWMPAAGTARRPVRHSLASTVGAMSKRTSRLACRTWLLTFPSLTTVLAAQMLPWGANESSPTNPSCWHASKVQKVLLICSTIDVTCSASPLASLVPRRDGSFAVTAGEIDDGDRVRRWPHATTSPSNTCAHADDRAERINDFTKNVGYVLGF